MKASRIFNWFPAWVEREVVPLALLFVVAGALLAFGTLMQEVLEGDTRDFDEAVLRVFRSSTDPAHPMGPLWLESAVRDVTSLGSTTVLTLITITALGFLLIDGRRAAAGFVLLSIGGGTLVSTLLKHVIARPRPDLVPHLVDVSSLSFPSGHAMLSAVTFLTLGALLARLQSRRPLKTYLLAVAVVISLLVGISRVYLGVHWPTDVLAGWCMGAAWAMLCWLAALWLQRSGQIESGST